MSIKISSNIPSLGAQRNLQKVEREKKTLFEQISSGDRLTKASIDPAALAISEQLESEIALIEKGRGNVDYGAALANVAEGGLEQIGNIVGRLDELAVQSANGTLSDADRSFLQAEATQLVAEIDRIAQTTTFNDRQILASDNTTSLQVGTDGSANSRLDLTLSGVSSQSLGLSGFDISSESAARNQISSISTARDQVSQNRGEVGAVQNRLSTIYEQLAERRVALSESNSRIRDFDIAQGSAQLTSLNIRSKAAVAVLGQANQQPANALPLLRNG